MTLNGKVALVTGAARGIGREIALDLAARGAKVSIHYRKGAEQAETTRGNLAGDGHRCFAADLADAGAASRLADTDMAKSVLAGPDGDAIRQQSPLERVARPEEVAATVGYLAAEAPEFLTGCIIDANGASYLRS